MKDKKTLNIIDSGLVMHTPDLMFSGYAWPSVTRNDNGDLVVVASGHRIEHVCPYGKVMVKISKDEGRTWTSPIVAIDTPLDDRDAGIINLGNGKLMISTFNNDLTMQTNAAFRKDAPDTPFRAMKRAYLPFITPEIEDKYLGSLLAISEDGGYTWGQPFRGPVKAPKGPILLKDGGLLFAGNPYLGKKEVIALAKYREPENRREHPIVVYKSTDHKNFEKIAQIPCCPEIGPDFVYCEPHVVEMPSGRLIMHIRADQFGGIYDSGALLCVVQTVSDDGGKTWTAPRLLDCKNGPVHLFLHSSGTLLCAHGRRENPYGIQVMFSNDEGETWDNGNDGYYIWDEGVNCDLGYPCTTELDNGDLFTVFYARAHTEKCLSRGNCPVTHYYAVPPEERITSIFWVRWSLPK